VIGNSGLQLPKLRPVKGAVIVSLIIMLAIPTWLLNFVPVSRHTISPATAWAIPAALGLFASGWLAAGASLRPNGSIWRGAVGGLAIYLVVGMLWMVAFHTATGSPLTSLVTPLVFIGAVFWPLGVAQTLGLFGLQMD